MWTLSVGLVVILYLTLAQGENTHAIGSNCDTLPCYNGGSCNHDPTGSICKCAAYFTGERCELLNIDIPEIDISKNSIEFEWPEKFDIYNYSCMYYATDHVDHFSWQARADGETIEVDIVTKHLEPQNTDTITIGDLEGDATRYVMCFFHQSTIKEVGFEKNSLMSHMQPSAPNCGTVITSYGGGRYTTAAKVVFALMVLTIAILIGVKVCICCSDAEKRREMTDDLKISFKQIKRQMSSKYHSQEDNDVDDDEQQTVDETDEDADQITHVVNPRATTVL